jgi:hypothetical protein
MSSKHKRWLSLPNTIIALVCDTVSSQYVSCVLKINDDLGPIEFERFFRRGTRCTRKMNLAMDSSYYVRNVFAVFLLVRAELFLTIQQGRIPLLSLAPVHYCSCAIHDQPLDLR